MIHECLSSALTPTRMIAASSETRAEYNTQIRDGPESRHIKGSDVSKKSDKKRHK